MITKGQYLGRLIRASSTGVFPSMIEVEGDLSQTKHNECVYRGPGQARCAFGLLIHDDKYVKKMEGKVANKDFATDFPDSFEEVEGFTIEGYLQDTTDYGKVQRVRDTVTPR